MRRRALTSAGSAPARRSRERRAPPRDKTSCPRQNLHGRRRVLHSVSPDQDTTRLYERYGQDLYRFCLARLRSPEEAEDAVQNTFMRVVRALEAGAEPEFESAWLYRIAANVCFSRRALTGRRAQWQTDEEIEQLPLAAPDADPETRRALIDAVTSLPKNQRDAILLREWQGLSYAEIADSLDTTVPAVETLLVRARRQLASLLRSRTRGGILDGLLLLRVRSWFAAASPAQLAAGAAVVALGGVAAGAGVGSAGTHGPAQRAAVPVVDHVVAQEPVPHVRRAHAAPAPTEPAATHHGGLPPAAVRFTSPVATVRAAAPRPAPAPEPPPAPPATVSEPTHDAPAAASAPGTATPAPTTLAEVAPAVTLPTVSVPAVTVTVAAVTLPASPAPAVPTPPVTVAVPVPALPPVLP